MTQYTQVRNKNSNTQGSSSNVPYLKELLLKERIHPLWEQILFLREVPILKRDAIEENHCLIQ